VQAATGVATRESVDEATPGALPCQLLDHGTGYLAAAAVLDSLRGQAVGGGTVVRRLSLARTALWLLTATGPDAGERSSGDPPGPGPWLEQFDDHGEVVEAVGPPGWLDDRPLSWTKPPARYLADRPAWANR
jgi:hypothetical protein